MTNNHCLNTVLPNPGGHLLSFMLLELKPGITTH
jgi:hypothetical protein